MAPFDKRTGIGSQKHGNVMNKSASLPSHALDSFHPDWKRASLRERLVVWAALRAYRKKGQQGLSQMEKTTKDSPEYRLWRKNELTAQFFDNFSAEDVNGKDVLDFGCGSGDLSLIVAEAGARSVTGTDLEAERVELAIETTGQTEYRDIMHFVPSTSPNHIPFADNSFDTILCFDVMEHVMEPAEVIAEWARVLRPGGQVLIWWMPWMHPYGHHFAHIMPVPWAHLLLDEAAFMRVCGRIYESDEYTPPHWHVNEDGSKISDPYVHERMSTWLNGLKLNEFEKIVADSPLKVAAFNSDPMLKQSFIGTALRPMMRVPVLREWATAVALYRLQKPLNNG
jgi:2-polyprenyl-3-methyl-5-hydroxy-6-metoxy-1,4-benzoquinol methylase